LDHRRLGRLGRNREPAIRSGGAAEDLPGVLDRAPDVIELIRVVLWRIPFLDYEGRERLFAVAAARPPERAGTELRPEGIDAVIGDPVPEILKVQDIVQHHAALHLLGATVLG